MRKMLVNFYIALRAFAHEVRALWVASSVEGAEYFAVRGGAERLDELEAEREEFDGILNRFQTERVAMNAETVRLRAENEEGERLRDQLMNDKVALMAQNAELVTRLDALTPEQVAAVVIRARAISFNNARLDALAKMALEQTPLNATGNFAPGSFLN